MNEFSTVVPLHCLCELLFVVLISKLYCFVIHVSYAECWLCWLVDDDCAAAEAHAED